MRTSLRVFALATMVLTGCARGPAPAGDASADRPTPVRAVAVETVQATSRIRAAGVLVPRDEFRLSFKVGGVLDRMLVDVGDPVQRGQTLAVLKQAEVDAAVAQAAESLEKAGRDLERARELQRDEVATVEQVQDLTTAYNVARANLQTARFNARFARIEAPSDGVVQQRLAKANELVQGGQPVLVVGATGEGWIVRTALADRDLVRVDVGTKAEVAFDAFPERSFAGVVTRVASAADPQTGTFEVEVEVVPGGARFLRGLVGRVSLEIDEPVSATRAVVPVTALVEANGADATVYVLDADGSTARRTQVAVGPIVGDRVIVNDGLDAGDRVITDGAAWLRDGQSVAVIGEIG
jgi:multidrug efflux system membrane fusion protein